MRIFRRRVEAQPPPGATPDEAATQPIAEVRREETEVVPAPRRRPPTIWPWLLALLVLVLAGLAAAYFLTRDDDEATEAASATVPDVVGLRVDSATGRLGREGFVPRTVQTPSERPPEVVVNQRPRAGASLPKGSAVTLVVSSGPRKVRVPDVVGLSLGVAFRRVEAAQLRPRARRAFSAKPSGRVIAQKPAAGTELEKEAAVTLTVSKGPGRVAVPTLVGMTEAEAAEALTAAGLETNVSRVASSEPVGTVVAQNPVAGTRVAKGSAVRINVSTGPAATTSRTTTTTTTATQTSSSAATVPDVLGFDEQTARRRLREGGFFVRAVTRATTDPADDGIVLEQRPAPRAPAPAGSEVTIFVGAVTP